MESRLALAKSMASIYQEQYAPPEWAVWMFATEYTTYAHRARLVIDAGGDRRVIERIAREREPVNLSMKRFYDLGRLNDLVGYRVSGYQSHFNENNCLAPNIGVYTFAPVMVGNRRCNAHIYHSVGAALDCVNQADYKVLVERAQNPVAVLTAFYTRVFTKIFHTAITLDLPRIIMSMVGANNFAHAYGVNELQKQIWVPAFSAVKKCYPEIRVDLMGGDPGPVMDYFADAHKTKLFPDVVLDAEDALIVNAWDPHSMPGNGNACDWSLDGFVGRSSAIHFFGWAMSNPYLLLDPLIVQ